MSFWVFPGVFVLGCFTLQRCWLLLERRLEPHPQHLYLNLFQIQSANYHGILKIHMDGFRKLGFYPQIIHFNRAFHYFHHPFWGTLIFGNTHIVWKKTSPFNYGILVCSHCTAAKLFRAKWMCRLPVFSQTPDLSKLLPPQPGAQITSIFEGQPPKTRPNFQSKTKGPHLGSRNKQVETFGIFFPRALGNRASFLPPKMHFATTRIFRGASPIFLLP